MNRALLCVVLGGAVIGAPAFSGERSVSEPAVIPAPTMRAFGKLPDGR